MVPEWYRVPVFYFSNPACILADGDPVFAPKGSEALDYELEIACIIGREARDLPDDDSALDCVAGFAILNDWSARDLQRVEMAVGLGPSKGKDFATSIGPDLVPFDSLRDKYHDGRLHLAMSARVNGRELSRGDSGAMHWTWPQLLAHASRDALLRPGDVLGSGTVGTGCILELTPEAVGGLAPAGGCGGIGGRAPGNPPQPRGRSTRIVTAENEEAECPPTSDSARSLANATSPTFARAATGGEGIYYEEVITTGGFGRAYSIAYHLRPPTRVLKVEPAGMVAVESAPQDVLRHHHMKTGGIARSGDALTGRIPLLANRDLTISRARPASPQRELYRNASADEVVFVHRGSGTLHTMLGPVRFRPFDYLVIPTCTTYRLEFEDAEPPDLLIVESAGSVTVPARYTNPDGQLKLGAPYYERDLRGPTEVAPIDRDEETTVLIRDGSRLTRYTLANHPFDVVGWDGMSYPFAFNADDFEPITGTVHQPPPVQQTFEAPGFVVCTFAPRMLDTHPEAIKVPYAHSNVQADEVLYYVRGHFGSRRGVEESSITVHPRGIPHGPHPGTIVASRDATRTDELAVMIDTHEPLIPTAQAMLLDDPSYPLSWID